MQNNKLSNSLENYFNKYLNFIHNEVKELNISYDKDNNISILCDGIANKNELNKINYSDLLILMQFPQKNNDYYSYIKNNLKPENFRYSDDAINGFLASLDYDSIKDLEYNLSKTVYYNRFFDGARKNLYENFKKSLDIAGLYKYEFNTSYLISQLDNQNIDVVIYDITNDELNYNKITHKELNHSNLLHDLKNKGFFKLLRYYVDKDGVMKSFISNEEREKIYIDLIKNNNLMNNGFIRYLNSQNILLSYLKDNNTFESLISANDTNNLSYIDKKTLDEINHETSRINNMENRYMSYLISTNWGNVREMLFNKSSNSLFFPKNSNIKAGFNLTYRYAFHFFITSTREDIRIPFDDIKLIHIYNKN